MSKAHWLALSMVSGIGGATLRRLIEEFGDIEAVFEASSQDLIQVPRVTPAIAERIKAISLPQIEDELLSLYEEGLAVLTLEDDDYPANLCPLSDAPAVLFVRGELLPDDEQAVAIVGTRQPREASLTLAETLGRELARHGLAVVSGLALGIDTAAHRGALAAGEGRTLAVLGSGLRVIHPRENVELSEEIAARGALLSELHPNTPPRARQLMARDRIISGLARAVIVVEAGENSGSLDTATRGRKQGRLIFAVGGSPGTEQLLSEGAISLPADTAALDFEELSQRIRAYPIPGKPEAVIRQASLW
jgi:DNA processing protein